MKVDKKYLRSLIVEEIQALDEFNPFKAAADKVKGFFGKKKAAAPAASPTPAQSNSPAPPAASAPSAPAVSAEQKQMDGFVQAQLKGATTPEDKVARAKQVVTRIIDLANDKMKKGDYDYAINASKLLDAALKKAGLSDQEVYQLAGRLAPVSRQAKAAKAGGGQNKAPPPPGSQPTQSTSLRKPMPPPPPPPPKSQKELEESVMEQFLNKVRGK